MIVREITVTNDLGVHARPAALIVKTISNFDASVTFEKEIPTTKNIKTASGRNIFQLLEMEMSIGTKIIIKVDGLEQEIVMEKIAKLFEDGFSEIYEDSKYNF